MRSCMLMDELPLRNFPSWPQLAQAEVDVRDSSGLLDSPEPS